MLDLRKLTTKEFANEIGEKFETILKLMSDCSHLSYVNNPYACIVEYVTKANISNYNREIVAKFIYTNICNRPEHRFFDTKGYSITLI